MSKIAISLLVAYGTLVAAAFGQTRGSYSEIFSETDYLSDSMSTSGAFEHGAGFLFGPLRVSPDLSVGYVYDSNPTYSQHGAKATESIRARPEVDLLLTGNGWNAFGNVWMTRDWMLGGMNPLYRDTVTQAHYGETLGFQLESAHGSRFSVTEAYEYQNRNDVVGSVATNLSWQDRYSLSFGAQLDTPLGEYTGMNLGASYSDIWYDNPLLYGWRDAGVSLGFSRKLSEKSDLLLSMGYDNQWSDGSSGESRSYRVLAGFGSHPTAKTSYRAEVGVMGYSFNNGENTAASWTYSLLGNWNVSQRLTANVSGMANFQPSETDNNNYTLVQMLSAGLSFEATRRLTTYLNAIYRREDSGKANVGSGEKSLDNQVGVSGRASYLVFRYTSVFVSADFSKNISTIDGCNYIRTILQSGVDIRF
ncbi:MAG: hypothetical protein ACOYOU_01080 [Kiritimatiellia bacterium]